MAVDWELVRYRGDAADVKELYERYRVEEYLQTVAQARGPRGLGLRESLLRDAVRLSDRLSPRIFSIYRDVRAAIGMSGDAEVYCVPQAEVNAFAAIDETSEGSHTLIGITSGALEKLEDGEIRFVLGHEIGHVILGNNRLNGLQNPDPKNPASTVLPPFGEALFLRWKKKAEVSVDRIGLVACGDFATAGRALLKTTFGLSDRNLNLDVESLVAQIDELRGKGALMGGAFASHPLLPIRLKALELFSRSAKARAAGFRVAGTPVPDAALEEQVDALMALTRRHPTDPLAVAAMEAVALGGALVLGSDGDVTNEEVKLLVQMLHGTFTDEPEGVIVTDRVQATSRLEAAVAVLVEHGRDDVKTFVLSRLCDLAISDGALLDVEGRVIHEIATRLGVPGPVMHSIMVSAAQSRGFGTDSRLTEITDRLRRSLKTGFAPVTAPKPWPPTRS